MEIYKMYRLIILAVFFFGISCNSNDENTISFSANIHGKPWSAEGIAFEFLPNGQLTSIKGIAGDGSSILLELGYLSAYKRSEATFRNHRTNGLVELVSFDVTHDPMTNDLIIHWVTASEAPGISFQIEKSLDAETFTFILEEMGRGSDNETTEYEVLANNDIHGSSFFRLLCMDSDGNIEELPLIHIQQEYFPLLYSTTTGDFPGYNGLIQIDNNEENRIISGAFNCKFKDASGQEKLINNGMLKDIAY